MPHQSEDWFAMTREGAAALLALRAAFGGYALYTPAGVVVRNDALLRHSEAVTDVTAVGIFACYLPRSVYRKIATPVCGLVRNDR